jgi:hypothetical protein
LYLLIVFSLDLLILIPNLCNIWIINLDLQIFIKSNGVYSSLFELTWEFLDPLGERGDFF